MPTLLLFTFSILGSFSADFTLSSERIFQFIQTSTHLLKWNSEKDFGPIVVSVLNDVHFEKYVLAKSKLEGDKKRPIEFKPFSFESTETIHFLYVGVVDSAMKLKLENWAVQNRVILIGQEKFQSGAPAISLANATQRLQFELDETGFSRIGVQVNATLKRISARLTAAHF